MSNHPSPEINAGSMADIAFLLLIFFLVTTTMDNDIGILKRIPQKIKHTSLVNERNVLEISINPNNEILVENSQKVDLKDLKQVVIDFIDNGARNDVENNPCDWCNGKKDMESSDHPAKAIIELESSRNTSYGTYVSVQNEINRAYSELRNKLALSLYGKSFAELENAFKKDKKNLILKPQIDDIKKKYPQLISEKEPEK